MKAFFKKSLGKLIKLLTNWHENISPDQEQNDMYHPLSPTSEAVKSNDYIEAIEWALQKSEKIKNIAITGPYGSGKSSIIQTFQKKHELNNNFHFLYISLATFKEDKKRQDSLNKDKENSESTNLLRLIELSILQQIFYHETDSTIPDSRFIKIEKRNKSFLRVSALGFLIGLVSYFYLVHPDYLAKFSIFELKGRNIKIAYYLSIFSVASAVYYFIYKLLFFIKSIVIKKVSVSNAEIELDQGISKSVLNKHLDEILYFFEMTKYNVVIIEDLDRFEQNEVFTKLRELNLLLNNSKKIKRDIVFLYAIKDDMFKDKDRAKFFDFIIPVIPIINSSNSNEMLIKLRDKNKYSISNDIIDDLSLFIDDMRLLYNIMNEFHMYSQKIDKKLNRDKLLGMIIYKNMYPNDFSSLGKSEGILFQTLTKKNSLVAAMKDDLQNKISAIVDEVKELDSILIENVLDLRRIYLIAIVDEILRTTNLPFFSFFIANVSVSPEEALENDRFEMLKSNLANSQFQHQSGRRRGVGFDFDTIEKRVNSDKTYDERKQLILDRSSGETNKKKQLIQTLEKKKSELSKIKLKDCLINEKIKIDTEIEDNGKQSELLNILLKQGYIDEDYLDYISIFYVGSLSRNDYNFLLNTKIQTSLGFDYKLDNHDNLLKKISHFEFEKPHTLNFGLTEYLIKADSHVDHLKFLFNQLRNETDESFQFINEFLNYTKNIEPFISLLLHHWDNMWGYIYTQTELTDQKKREYFNYIIMYADIADIRKAFQEYKNTFADYGDFLTYFDNETKIIEIIDSLRLQLEVIDNDTSEVVSDFIYNNNYYKININNLKHYLVSNGTCKLNDFNTRNLSTLNSSGLTSLQEFVNDNLEFYLLNVFLRIKLNTNEDKDTILSLVNNIDISEDIKSQVIEKSSLSFEVKDIDDMAMINIILKQFKITVAWQNLLDAYVKNENVISEEIITYLNDSITSIKISEDKIAKDYPDEETASEFISSLLKDDRIFDECYANLLKSIPYVYKSIQLEGLSENKVISLINLKILETNNVNFQHLKEHFKSLHILLLDNGQETFTNNIADFNLGLDDYISLLEENTINLKSKEMCLKQCPKETIFSSSKMINTLANLILEEDKVQVESSILIDIIKKNSLNPNDKIEMFIKSQSVFTEDDITDFLKLLPEPYPTIAYKGKRPKINASKLNESFVSALKAQGYISSARKTLMNKIQIMTFKSRD